MLLPDTRQGPAPGVGGVCTITTIRLYVSIVAKLLQVIVKELWTLRLQKLYERNDEGYLSDDNTTQVFSSQTEQSTAVDDEENRYHKKQLSNSPKAVESLALCYLGILLLRIPVSIGYIQRYYLLWFFS